MRDCIYLTPHFLNHFDFSLAYKINNYGILRLKFKFASNQLGFDVLRQNLKQYAWQPIVKFFCPVGFADYVSYYHKDNTTLHDHQPCSFFAKY
jgi:hypothetical protein